MPAKNTQPKAQQSQPSISTAEMLKVLQQLQQEAAREEAAAAAAEAEQKRLENAEKTLVFYLNNNAPLLDGDIVIGTVGTLPSMIDGERVNPSDGAGLRCRLAIKREHFVALGGKLKRSASRSGKAQLHGYLQGGRKITAVIQDPFFVEDLQDASGDGVLLQGSIVEIMQSVPHAGGVPVKVTPDQIRLAAENAKAKSREGLALWRENLEPRTIITDTDDQEDTFN